MSVQFRVAIICSVVAMAYELGGATIIWIVGEESVDGIRSKEE